MESVKLLANAANVFVEKLVVGLVLNADRCRALIDQSLMMVTSLAPVLGYETCAKLAKQAFRENKTIRQLVSEQKLLPAEKLDELLDPDAMTRPS
jgi:fumarate hydratase class II